MVLNHLRGRIEIQLLLSLAQAVRIVGTVDNHLDPPSGVASGRR
jgi:hypothetical protein